MLRAKSVVEYIARSLVDNAEGVRIEVEESGDNVRITLEVDQDDIGKIIGRGGRTARAMRSLTNASGALERKKVHLEIRG